MRCMPNEIIPVHSIVSRDVTAKDIPRVLLDGLAMYERCLVPHGVHKAAFAIAHPQITQDDPLRFFSRDCGDVVINPVIVRHTNQLLRKPEGCMSFPTRYATMAMRWNKIEVEYLTWPEDVTDADMDWDHLEKRRVNLSGKEAQIFQHEINHFDAVWIFPIPPPVET